jgi:hypothetical protein
LIGKEEEQMRTIRTVARTSLPVAAAIALAASSIPYGFTIFSFDSEIPLFGASNPPLTFTGGGSAIAVAKGNNE